MSYASKWEQQKRDGGGREGGREERGRERECMIVDKATSYIIRSA
jgi:hypothetical protein